MRAAEAASGRTPKNAPKPTPHPAGLALGGLVLIGCFGYIGLTSLQQRLAWSAAPVRLSLDDRELSRYVGTPVYVVGARCLGRHIRGGRREPYGGGAELLAGARTGVIAVAACARCVKDQTLDVAGVLIPAKPIPHRQLPSRSGKALQPRFEICTHCTQDSALAGVIVGALFSLVGLIAIGGAGWQWRKRARALALPRAD